MLKLKLKFFLSIAGVLILPALLPAVDKEDSQLWTETWIYLPKFHHNFSYGYINNTRVGNNVSTITDERQSIFLTYHISRELNFTSQNTYIEQQPAKDLLRKQYRPMIDAHGVVDGESVLFPYRLRVERQFREGLDDKWNLRPRLGIEIPNTFCNIAFNPFLNAEGFYDSEPRAWYRLRALAGFIIKPSSMLTFEPYIGRQLERYASARDLSLFGFNLKIYF